MTAEIINLAARSQVWQEALVVRGTREFDDDFLHDLAPYLYGLAQFLEIPTERFTEDGQILVGQLVKHTAVKLACILEERF